MSELLGAFYLAVVALAIYLAYRAERREIERERRRYARMTRTPKKKRDLWHKAYLVSKSALPESEWKAWMQARGYGPETVIERAEIQNENVK